MKMTPAIAKAIFWSFTQLSIYPLRTSKRNRWNTNDAHFKTTLQVNKKKKKIRETCWRAKCDAYFCIVLMESSIGTRGVPSLELDVGSYTSLPLFSKKKKTSLPQGLGLRLVKRFCIGNRDEKTGLNSGHRHPLSSAFPVLLLGPRPVFCDSLVYVDGRDDLVASPLEFSVMAWNADAFFFMSVERWCLGYALPALCCRRGSVLFLDFFFFYQT